MYGFGSSEIDLSTCYKGRPEKVLIEDQKKDKKGCVLLSQFSIVQTELKCLLVETYS